MDTTNVSPIKRTKLSDEVYRKLLQMINEGTFKLGEKLPPETELCEIFGVSRTALREGVNSLARMNVLGIEQGRGTFVRNNPDILVEEEVLSTILGRESMEHMIEFRGPIDMGIARYAALNATENDLEAMRESLDMMEQSLDVEPPDFDLFMKGDLMFHYSLCKATQNHLFEKIGWPLVKYTIKRGLSKIKDRKETLIIGLEDHKRIFESIRGKDVDGALENMNIHLYAAFDLQLR